MGGQVQVRFYAAARELAGCETDTLALPAAEVSAEQFFQLLGVRHPSLAPYLGRLRLAINDELRPDMPSVRDGDVVDVMPPVAGGSEAPAPEWSELVGGRGRVGLSSTPLSVDAAIGAVQHPSAGGIALFLGVVRDHADGRAVTRLDYEAHATLAGRELANVANEVLSEHAGVRVCAVHRVGELAIGDLAVIVAASAPHRAEAFAACRALIERIKERVPIWKKEWTGDGTSTWVNL